MRIKTFQGRSLEEVLPEIRAELGPNAVVIGQRTKVQGGVAGFFGTKVIEVTAADSMPSDDQLVELEDQLMNGEGAAGGGSADASADGSAAERDDQPGDDASDLATRFAGAMKMGRRGGLDVIDEWDPAQDAELAHEYGRVLEHAAAAGFSELDVPVIDAASATLAAPPLGAKAPMPAADDPLAQAQALAARTHEQVQQATSHMDQAVYAPQMSPTYAPPRALPTTTPVEDRARTFAASVLDTPMQGYDPAAVPSFANAASTVDEALRADLGLPPAPVAPAQHQHRDQISQALDAAVDMIDLKAMAALRNAVQASRRLSDQGDAGPRLDIEVEHELSRVTDQLASAGVDDDVIEALTDTVLRHRRPFGGQQDVHRLMREVVEETLDVRTGFPRLGRAYRMAFVGASSCGKTTVVAKVAAGYRAAGVEVGVLSIIAADPNLAVMGDNRFNGLGVDVRYAATPDQAAQGAEAFVGHDLVLIDTPGNTYLDRATYAQVEACLSAIGIDDVHVVLPLATSTREARAVVDAFRPLGANRLVVSRLDESRYIGQLLNFGFRLGVPMTFLSEGPRVPGDLRAASARAIADRILPAYDGIS